MSGLPLDEDQVLCYPSTSRQRHGGSKPPESSSTDATGNEPEYSVAEDDEGLPYSEQYPTSHATCNVHDEPNAQTVAELQFEYFHHLAALPSYSFLHADTVVRRLNEKSLSEPLKLALCAIAALLLGHQHLPATAWVDRAEKALFDVLDRPSVFHLQALLLIIQYRAAAGYFARAFMLAGLAARAAAALRLHYEHSELSSVAQESRRRTFWALYLLEDLFSVGIAEYELCRPETIHLRLPNTDDSEAQGRTPAFLNSDEACETGGLGSHAAVLKLTSIRRSIMKVTRRILSNEQIFRHLLRDVNRHQTDLENIRKRLEPHNRYPPSDFRGFEWRPIYLMLHVSWHQCHCDLYRMFLPNYLQASPSSVLEGVSSEEQTRLGRAALKHAEEIAHIIGEFCRYAEDLRILELDTAVCAYHGARLILFGAFRLTDSSVGVMEKQRAISTAKLCLDFISRFFANTMASRPIRDDLTRLIRLQESLLASPSEGSPVSPDEAPTTSPGVSTFANARQKLSVHSLLLQSDFVDDSGDIAPSATEQPPRFIGSNTLPPATEHVQQGQSTVDSLAPDLLYPLFDGIDPFGISYWENAGLSQIGYDSAFAMPTFADGS
ncbi:uncharacterized protein LTR77_008230 [Saxophila tyrrhenica]|uniref:Xylanolytic transcriptional activator regulatory domain-containing protein n=1 Tax=Saxophila tyrrhenica TaxID=1690608 RepID=A0AAV9P611_9PEZI|nr:hypothetical protein LTR77_008230 [Saxophila tyrrhenica]